MKSIVGQLPALHISSFNAISVGAMSPATPGSSSALASNTAIFVDLNPGKLERAACVAASRGGAPRPPPAAAGAAGGAGVAPLGPLIAPAVPVPLGNPQELPGAGCGGNVGAGGAFNPGTGFPDMKIAPF